MLREETRGDPARTRAALAGLRRYQEAERPPPPAPRPAVASRGGAMVRDHGGEGAPILLVPSLINPPTILDLDAHRSLARWLAARGHRVLLLDWGWPDAARRELSVAGHVETLLLPLLAGLGEPVHLAGYCLGGTMALAAASLTPARSLALIAAPWHFAGFPDEARADLARLWAECRTVVDRLGVLPMEALQTAFWRLDPARTIAKFEAFAATDEDRARAFVALEDWANDGPPLPAAAARELFEDFFGADRPGSGAWRVGGQAIDPAALRIPLLDVASTSDRIVPAASAAGVGERIELDLGHVGMMVGRRASTALWEPLDRWLSGRGDGRGRTA